MGIAKKPSFDANTIQLDTNLKDVGVDSYIVGGLHVRLQRATNLAISGHVYEVALTTREIANILEAKARGEMPAT